MDAESNDADPGGPIVQLRDLLGIIRARWKTLLVCLLLVLGATAAVTLRTTPVYEARASVFFAPRAEGYTITKSDLGIFSRLLSTPLVTAPVAKALGLPEGTPIDLSGAVSEDGPFLDIVARSNSGQRAADIANAAGPELAKIAGNYATQLAAEGGGVKSNPISPAAVPSLPVDPNYTRNALVGLLASLGLGVGVILLRHFLDSKVRTDADLRALSSRPILAHLRKIRDLDKDRLIVETDPHSLAAEEFRRLRTNLQFVDVTTGGRHSFVITSPAAGEGKTTVAVNLALAVASAGPRVLIVDGDLRHPSVANALGLEGGVGLTTILLGRARPEEVIQPWRDTGLFVLPAGETPPNPSELLDSDATRNLFEGLLAAYDFVIVDSPPIGPVIDPVLINRLVGGMLMVVTSGQTTKRDLTAALRSLETVHESVSGFALNQVEGGGSYYAYGSKEAYAAGRSTGKRRNSGSARRAVAARSATSPARAQAAPR